MGSSGSKAAKSATGAAARRYPSRSGNIPPTSGAAQNAQSKTPEDAGSQRDPPATKPTRDDAIDIDGQDPQFAASLRTLGPVKPAPTYSPSATHPSDGSSPSTPSSSSAQPPPPQSPSLTILAARQRIQEAADRERAQVGKKGFEGRTLIEISTVRKVLVMRDEQGMEESQIEAQLGLRKGFVKTLGAKGVVEVA
ncbi:MAG: hypothetical protein M1828_000419 [Chrysothrix sp. TS-e1954]|nr:MAG: hypothetical protein M1828_000419 [Chrysothrix sp. TS-e1954]